MVMRLRSGAPDWEAEGAKCLEFPATRESDPWFDDEQQALQICNGWSDGRPCPARHECLIFSLINNEAYGVWGGMLSDDRATLRRFTPREDWEWRPPSQPLD